MGLWFIIREINRRHHRDQDDYGNDANYMRPLHRIFLWVIGDS